MMFMAIIMLVGLSGVALILMGFILEEIFDLVIGAFIAAVGFALAVICLIGLVGLALLLLIFMISGLVLVV